MKDTDPENERVCVCVNVLMCSLHRGETHCVPRNDRNNLRSNFLILSNSQSCRSSVSESRTTVVFLQKLEVTINEAIAGGNPACGAM